MLLNIVLIILVLLVAIMAGGLLKLAADSRNMSVPSGLVEGRLRPCPPSPNCVSSDVPPEDNHYIAAIADSDGARWATLVDRVSAMEGATLVTAEDGYAHFTFRTPVMGFVDDVEFHYRPAEQIIAVRSASRVGYSDWNANRKRIDAIRAVL